MVSFPPAKLNLGLHVLGKRADGFHELESIFLPIAWTDMLEVVLAPDVPHGDATFTWTGLPIPGDPENNLIVRAHRLLAERHALPGVSIHLHKILPMGGGVGGGSADGTYTLRALNEVCGLGLSQHDLMALAAELGSDCPFFVQDGPALVQGRGEVVKTLPFMLSLQGWWVVVTNPGIHIGTSEAFADLSPTPRTTKWESLGTSPVNAWSGMIRNDFEEGARARHPEVGALIDALTNEGAAYAQMTGSGSTVFGIFEDAEQAKRAAQLTHAGFCGPVGVD